MDCPKCVGRLQKKTITNRETSGVKELQGAATLYELEVDQCFVCNGVWLDKGELDKYMSDGIEVIDSPSLGAKTDKQLDEKCGNCPRCKIKLKKASSPKASDMIIDICEKCGGVWLDSTEIDRLERAHKPKSGFLDLFFKGFKK